MTLLVQPPSAGLVSGGYLYNARMAAALSPRLRLVEAAPAELPGVLAARAPGEVALVDSLYLAEASGPTGAGLVLLAHAMPEGPTAPVTWLAGVCPSQHAAATVRARYPGLTTHVCRPGVSRRHATPLPPPGRLELVTVANLFPAKGHLELAQALASLGEASLRWTIVGDERVDPAQARAVRAAVARGGLDSRTRWLGAVEPEVVTDVVTGCHVLVHPSRRENYGMVLAEAIALGRPVVACAVGGVPEVVHDGVTGLLVDPASPRALAAAIGRLRVDPALLARLHRGCVEAAAGFPTWPEAARELAAALEVLEARAPAQLS